MLYPFVLGYKSIVHFTQKRGADGFFQRFLMRVYRSNLPKRCLAVTSRVCLVNPPRIHPTAWGKPSVLYPLDILYVAALLEKEHKVRIIDAPAEGYKNLELLDPRKYRFGLSAKQIEAEIKQFSPDVVVVSAPFLGWWRSIFEVATSAKNVDKSSTTVLMGMDPSVRPVDCLNEPNIDFVVIGEPDQTVLELIDALEKGKSPQELKKVKGIAFIEGGQVTITPPRPLITDLDNLPFPARHLLPMGNYFAAVKENPLRGEISKPWVAMITSRGCPQNCIFCSTRIVQGRVWRPRSPQNVIAEIEQLIQTYGIKQIDFEDGNLTYDMKRMETICDMMIERRLDLQWYTPNGVRADRLDEHLLAKMARAGCKKIRIAPESGVQRVVDNVLKKNLPLTKVEEAIVAARKVGIGVGCFFILGAIGETKEDMKATIAYARKLRGLGADRFYFSYATPLYGTELYEQAKASGYLRGCFSEDSLAAAEPLIETKDFTVKELQELCAEAVAVNPTFTGEKIKRSLKNPKKTVKMLLSRH
jgi:magnesium-protoporphyrin IX monomethyl ester (oxidative) cyclase